MNFKEEILELAGILEEGMISDKLNELKGRVQERKQVKASEKEKAWLKEFIGSETLMKKPDKVVEILTGKGRIYDENKLLHYLTDVAGFSYAVAKKAITNNVIIRARTKANADIIMNKKY